jgi:lysophospholipase L1-like esterase
MKVEKTLLFIGLVILMLAMLSFSFPKGGVKVGRHRLYFPSLEDVLAQKPTEENILQKMKEVEESFSINQYRNSAVSAKDLAYNDSIAYFSHFFNTHSSRIYLPNNDLTFFNSLFKKMEDCKKENQVVHILHYGDSQIEGDRITGYIRQQLQEKFGGKGPGLLPVVQPIPSASVGQTVSGDISRHIIAGNLMDRAGHQRYGVLGQVAHTMRTSSISIATRDWKATFENVKEFTKIRLYVGHNNGLLNASLMIPDHEPMVNTLGQGRSNLSVLKWNLKTPSKKFTLELSGSAEIYGIAADGDYGVAVDNIPLRGSSGTFFTEIDSLLMQAMLEDLNVGLIIMEYGGNMMPSIRGDRNVADYKNKLSEQINYFKKLYPDAKILMIGPADMSTKEKGKLQTYPYLEKAVNGMKETALENGAAFWDMYQVMGGKDSMIKWVQNKPTLAAPDYIHFTTRGADQIAKTFYESFMMYYNYYDFQKNYK